MKILFTADWHIKLGQKNVPREWQKNRYIGLFSKISKLAKDVDLVIIGGDIFDKMPSLEELELYFIFLSYIDTKTIIFDGNHEATKRGHTFMHNLIEVTKSINNKVDILNGPHTIDSIDFIPYTELKTFKPEEYSSKILCTHVRGAIPPHVQPEIDLDKFNKWDIVLAGDLHAYSNSQRNILYPGSPLSTSFHRNSIDNGIIIFDTDNLSHEWVSLGLPQLIRKTIEDHKEAVKTDYDHTIYEIIGDIKSLSNVDTSNEFIDKKITNKTTESVLDLKSKSVSEELHEYLSKIQNMKSEDILSVIKVFHDYIEKDEMV